MQHVSAPNHRLAAERRDAILRILAAEHRVVASELGRRLSVSTDTIQRDLASLEDRGALRRVRGGALPSSPGPRSRDERATVDVEAKSRMAAKAWDVVGGIGVVAIGGGSTTALMVERVPPDASLTIATAAPDLASALVGAPGVEVHLVGGRMDERSRTVVGAPAVDAFRMIRPDVAVLSACSIDAEAGVTMQNADEAAVVKAMIAGARRLVVLATAARLGTAAPFVVADCRTVDVLVTDAGDEATASIARAGVEIRVA